MRCDPRREVVGRRGQRVDAVTLVDGNPLTIGRTQILFWDGTQNSGVNG